MYVTKTLTFTTLVVNASRTWKLKIKNCKRV